MIISEVVQMTVEQISRKYTLYCFVLDRHLFIIFLANNDTTISSNIALDDNTGEFYK